VDKGRTRMMVAGHARIRYSIALGRSGVMKFFYVYMLRCADGSYYVGHTDDLELRIAKHHEGTYACYTHERRPVELVFAAEFSTRVEALERERQLKGWTRAKKEALIRNDWDAIHRLARCRASTGCAPFDSGPSGPRSG
jgi:predicted GIY-YIG superfamily endonuclease